MRTQQHALRFLVDVGVGKKVELWLTEQDYNVKCVRDIDPTMRDREILKLAVSEKRMVITMDKDFGELVFNSGQEHGGVLLLRLEEAASHEKLSVIETILTNYENKLMGKFCVYKSGKLRIRSK